MNTQRHVFYGAEGRYVAEVDFDRVTAELDALQQLLNARDEEVAQLRLLVRSGQEVEDHLSKQIDISEITIQGLRAKLSEAQVLLSTSSELLRTISMHTAMSPSQWCDSFQREVKDRIQKIAAALSASAEPSAPLCTPAHPCVFPDSCGHCSKETSAPVEIDERAEFEKWYLAEYFEGDKQCGLEWLSTEPCGGYRYARPAMQWKIWQARAALERK